MGNRKIAVCLSGELRDCKSSLENWSRYYPWQSLDFFITTWDEIGGKGNKYNSEKINEDQIKDVLHPKVLCVQKKPEWDSLKLLYKMLPEKSIHPDHPLGQTNSFISQYQTWYKTSLLFKDYCEKEKTSYDIVIRSRPDLFGFWKEEHWVWLRSILSDDTILDNKIFAGEGETIYDQSTRNPRRHTKNYWKNSGPITPVVAAWRDIDSLQKTGFALPLHDSFYKNFLLDDVRHLIDKEEIRQSLSLLNPPILHHALQHMVPWSNGISDTANLTNQQNYLLYTRLMFWMFFLVNPANLLSKRVNVLAAITSMLNLETSVIPGFSYQLGEPYIPPRST